MNYNLNYMQITIFSRRLSILIFLLFFVNFSFSQRAKDGNFTASSVNTIVNSYTFLTSNVSVGATTINVDNNAMIGGVFGTPLAAGDLILIIQMQGASINCNVTPTTSWGSAYTVPDPFLWTFDWAEHIEAWGAITNYNNAGKYERVEVLSVTGTNIINLQCGLKNNYTASGHVQIVRIPRFDNLAVSGGMNSIVPTYWNGQTGGIVAIEVQTNININAGSSISASGFGFRAGQLDNFFTSGSSGSVDEVRYLGSSDPAEGSEKGESILGYYAELDALFSRYGISAPANGGGGGGYQNAGGGGGSNIGSGYYTGNGVPDPTYNAAWALDLSNPPNPNPSNPGNVVFTPINGVNSPGGGRGGYSLSSVDLNALVVGPRNTSWGSDYRRTNGGRGGHPLTYDATRLFFGGGGGAGEQDNGEGGAGGRGGGIVYITCYGTVTGSGTIEVDGQAGQNSNPNNLPTSVSNPRRGNDGAGGGGAGGSIFFETINPIPSSINLNAIGGDGGDQNFSYAFPTSYEASGTGGSGAGGSIAFSSGTPTQNVSAGVNGVTNSVQMTEFPPNGATSGSSGVGSLPASVFDITASNVSICSGSTANLTASVVGTLPSGGVISWYSQQFGGTALGTGTTFTTPVLTATTTYYVGVCPGTFRIPVIVTVTGTINLTITNPAAVCSPGTIDLTAAAVTAGSDPGTLTYWTDAAATTSLANPNAVATSGTYYIQLDNGSCTAIQPVVATINPIPNLVITNPPSVCSPGTVDLTAASVTAGSDAGTLTYWTDAAATTSLANPNAVAISGTYYIQLDNGSCTTIQPVVVTINPTPNLVITNPPAVCSPSTVDLTAASVTAGSDAGTLTYWTDAAATTALANPNAVAISGTYYIQLDDGNCTTIQSVVATINPLDNASFTMSPTCDGGTATITGTTGGIFSFNVAPVDAATINSSTGTITGGTGGNSYDVLYTTSGVCPASSVVSVTAYNVTYTATITNENCGAADGQIVLVASGGAGGPYQYSITGGAPYVSSGTFSGLSAGNYSISIIDNGSSCIATGTESVSAIGGPSIDNLTVTNPSCFGACDGQIVATVSGGSTPYTYQWFDATSNPIGTNSATITGLCSGNYSLQVTDAGGSSTTVIFNEDFGNDATGCDSQGTLANGYNSGSGAWTITATGTNDADANLWYVSSMEAGVGAGNCGTTCSATELSRTLHVSNPAIPIFGLSADQGAAYNAGGLCPSFFCVASDVRAESPAINLSGTGMTLTFDYIHLGDGTDQCELVYFDGATWVSLGVLPNTAVASCGGGQHLWAQYTWAIPASLNGLANFKIGYRWTNNDDGVGTDPSVAIDNIQISYAGGGGGCSANANAALVDPAPLNLTISNPSAVCSPGTVDITAASVTAGSDVGTLTYWTDATATTSLANPNAVAISGTYYIQLDNGTCSVVQPVTVTVNPLPNLVITDPSAVCSPATVDITDASVTSGSDAGTLTYWTDATATTALATPNAVATSGTYYIQLDNGTCSVVQPVTVTVNPLPNLVITDPSAVCSPATVDITAASITAGSDAGTLTYWTDATATTALVTPNAVATSGTYYIQLDNGTCSVVQPVTVTVNPLPNLVITNPPAVCSPGTVDLTAASITAGSDAGTLTYWADATATTALATPNAVATSGTYYVQLDNGTCSIVQPVTVTINPSPTITGVNTVCVGFTTQLTGSGSPDATTPWSSSDATIAIVDNTGLVTGIATGTVTITYLDINGCSSTINVVVSTSITPTFTAVANVCQNDPAPVLPTTSTNGITGTWSPAVSTATVGTTTYTFTPTAGQCATTTTLDITVDAPVIPTFPAVPNVCQNTVLPPLPTTSTNGITGTWSPVLSTVTVGTTTYTFTPTAGQCATTTTLDITVDAPILPTFTAVANVCQNDPAPVLPTTSTNGITGTWSPAVSTATVGTTTYTFTPTAGQCATTTTLDITVTGAPVLNPIIDVTNCGPYTLPIITGTNLSGNEAYYNDSQANGGTLISGVINSTQTVWVYDASGTCSDEISFVVTINPLPNVSSFSGGANYCAGDIISDVVVNVSGTPSWTLNYTLDGTAQSITSTTNTIILGNAGGVYDLVSITDGSGCTNNVSGTQTIQINPIPLAPVVSADAEYCSTGNIDFMTAVGDTSGTLYWYSDASLSNIIGSGQAETPSSNVGVTTYYVVDEVNGCQSPSSSITITITDCEIVIPTAFTPDNDGNNDTWEIPGLDERHPNNIVRVYNRWGNLVFEHVSTTGNPYNMNEWDGTFKGKLLPVGSYFFIIDVNDNNDDTLKGSVSIILNK